MINVEKIDKGGYYLTLLLALSTSASVACGSIAMYVGLLLIILRYVQERSCVLNIERGMVTAGIIFVTTVGITCIFSFDPLISFQALLKYSTRIIPLIMVFAFVRSKKQIILIISLMAVSIFIADIYGLWQKTQGIMRPSAFYGNPIFFAGHLLQMIILLVVVVLEHTDLTRLQRGFLGGMAVISMAVLLFNGTRGAWVAIVCSLVVMCIVTIQRNKKVAIISALIILVLGILFFSNPALLSKVYSIFDLHTNASNDERLLLWQSSWHMFRDHPLMGLGLEGFQYYFKSQYILPGILDPNIGNSHNNLFAFLAETGIIGTVGYLWLFGFLLVDLYRKYRRNSGNFWALTAFLITIGVQIHGMTDCNFAEIAVMRLYWFIIGICYVAMNQSNSESFN